jgi:hypothetical protein
MLVDVAVNAVIAAIALVALVVSWRVSRRQTAIQERVAAIEEARRTEEIAARAHARVTASVTHEQRDHRGRDVRLVLHNDGPALARGVQVDLEEGPTNAVIGLEALPVDLQPGQSTRFPVALALGDHPILRITVRWADEAGNHAEPYTLQVM